MITNDVAHMLHDKATRGIPLSPEEHVQLEAWYRAQDNAEYTSLGLTARASLPNLQSQVTAALARYATLTQRIQELADENEALRREIVALR